MKMRSRSDWRAGFFAGEQLGQFGVEIFFAQIIFFEHALHVGFVFAVEPTVDDEFVGVLVNRAFHLLVLADGVDGDACAEPGLFHERRRSRRRRDDDIGAFERCFGRFHRYNVQSVFLADFLGVVLTRLRRARSDADFFQIETPWPSPARRRGRCRRRRASPLRVEPLRASTRMATVAAAAVRTAWHQSSSMNARISPPSRSLRIRIRLGPRGGRDTSRLPPAALIERMRKPATGSVASAQPVTHDCQPCSGLIAKSSGVDQMTRPSL